MNPVVSPLLSVDLTVAYGDRKVLRGMQLDLQAGEIVGLVGASGSGKSTLALALLGLLKFKGATPTGSILLGGRDLLRCTERELRAIRGKEIGLVLQSAQASLNPALSLMLHFKEAWRAHSRDPLNREWLGTLLRGVDLPSDDEFLRRLPRQISIGQAQRVLIALALLHRPPVVVADEPTSALDLITQREVLNLLKRIQRDLGTAILCISHDLLAIASLCQRVAILHDGVIVDSGSVQDVFTSPQHSYSQALIAALPRPAFLTEPAVSPQATDAPVFAR